MTEYYLEETNLSVAWARLFDIILNTSKHELSPFIVSIKTENHAISEYSEIREKINLELKRHDKFSVETVASTIFPKSFWNDKLPRESLYKRYIKIFPKIKRIHQNYGGTYFQRLISFNSQYDKKESINQLEELIQGWHSGVKRRSFYQAAIFDPRKDQSRKPLQGFPCMRHVSFNIIDNSNGQGLEIMAIYATQTVFEKAYGNYLGLIELGKFMAKEMGLTFEGLKCISTRLILQNGNASIKTLKSLNDELTKVISRTN